MIALDTNVLIRVLTGDDDAQAAQARRLLEGLSPDAPGFVGREVMLEVVWVLRSVHRLPRTDIADAVESILGTAAFVVETAEDVAWALDSYRRGDADFADLMILAAARRAGAGLFTFDRKLAGQDGVTLLEGA